MPVEVGQPAPEFTLKDQNNQDVSLSDFRGKKNVVLMFYPFAFTKVCEGEMCAIRDELPSFENDDVQILTVSVDSPFSHKVWGEQQGFTFPMLADFWPHGEVAQAYGCFDPEKGRSIRGTYIIDKQGVLRWSVVNPAPDARDQAEYLKVLAELG
jgi:peroxiredoxin